MSVRNKNNQSDPKLTNGGIMKDDQEKPVYTSESLKNTIYTVVIQHTCDTGAAPWISAFDSREKQKAFIAKAKQRIAELDVVDLMSVVGDSGEVNSEEYLDWLEAEYGSEDSDE